MYSRIYIMVCFALLIGCGDSAEKPPPIQNTSVAAIVSTQTPTTAPLPSITPAATNTPIIIPTSIPTNTPTASPTPSKTPTATTIPTNTPTHTPTATATPRPTQTPTPLPLEPCTQRVPTDNLLINVTRKYGLSEEYAPSDLVPLSDYFPWTVYLGFPTDVRQVIVPDLERMINAMLREGLHPAIVSGYRSYYQQAVAQQKWRELYPDRADALSAVPGTSEHQLGTTVDIGSPELDNEFHTDFYMTAEGSWLIENAHFYGFTLSYPRNAFDITEFLYEPWHYRYIGVELATQLYLEERTLTEYLLTEMPVPCISAE